MPVLAAARNPPVNTTAGTPYNQLYSGGSVGRLNISSMRYDANLVHKFLSRWEHMINYLGDDEAACNIYTSQQDGQGTEYLGNGAREISSAHDEQPANADHS